VRLLFDVIICVVVLGGAFRSALIIVGIGLFLQSRVAPISLFGWRRSFARAERPLAYWAVVGLGLFNLVVGIAVVTFFSFPPQSYWHSIWGALIVLPVVGALAGLVWLRAMENTAIKEAVSPRSSS
jgi:hypothetical protein